MSLRAVVEKWGGVSESPMDLYSDVFKLGEGWLQTDGEAPGEFKANPIAIGHANGRMHRKILFEDTFSDTLAEFQRMDWAFIAPVSYFGRHNTAERQSKLFAFVFDLDGVTDSKLNAFLSGAIDGGAYPVPQHIVLSGHGVHLYYVLETPLDLYPNIKAQAKELKYALTRKIWNRYTSTIKEVQYQGINQSFRVPGSHAKPGARLRVCAAMRLSEHPTTVGELNEYVPEESRMEVSRRWPARRLALEEAKSKYPDWYRRVLVDGGQPGQWVVKEDLYRWWLRQVETGATYGHRYFCIMALAIFAAKCGIYDEERVRTDALALVPFLNSVNPDHPFTEADALSALDCLDSRYVRFPRRDIEKLTGIEMAASKRNGLTQAQHLYLARRRKEDMKAVGVPMKRPEGRPKDSGTKRAIVRDFAAAHPGMSHTEMARALGVSRPTVIKWLRDA